MRIDFEELKRILTIFLDSKDSFITLGDLGFATATGEDEQRLIFHTLLLVENGLISNWRLLTRDPCSIGFVYRGMNIEWRKVPIRLTQDGHDFAMALNRNAVMERIKRELADAPFDLVKDVSKQWLTKLIRDKIGIQ
ncbi:DUF2513 domain-containing protein [Pantoea rodasii]|uniref:DUF2513 domain-containing protein n=1 Tax=Pantoea rodasii TaxID=1076549 RepID=A0A2M9WI31_9GAMM|nr:DUF2513 domain-containing protein [Pantoea rodasii]PJZ07118.1 DUF2513 domain-containing protein [Pantoea rodasii]